MDIIVYAVAAVIVAIILWFVTRRTTNDKAEGEGRHAPQEREEDIPGGVRRRRRDVRDRIRRMADSHQQDGDGSGSEEEHSKKIGVKKQRKLQEKEERRIAREAAEREREERKQAQEERDEMLKKQEEERLVQEAKELEEEKRLEEEREKREHEEYLKMKEMFDVEEEGEDIVPEEEESENLLHEFIAYIKESKVVLLEDLASHFGLRTQAAIDRVQDLLTDGLLSGVIDDRGKFIYISPEELKAVAEFVEQRGRVSISELAKASNTLINLKPEKELALAK